jgi:hypothetical protein
MTRPFPFQGGHPQGTRSSLDPPGAAVMMAAGSDGCTEPEGRVVGSSETISSASAAIISQ